VKFANSTWHCLYESLHFFCVMSYICVIDFYWLSCPNSTNHWLRFNFHQDTTTRQHLGRLLNPSIKIPRIPMSTPTRAENQCWQQLSLWQRNARLFLHRIWITRDSFQLILNCGGMFKVFDMSMLFWCFRYFAKKLGLRRKLFSQYCIL
jgi:hypothetical protein